MIFRLAAFVLPLGLDTLAVSIALGIRGAPFLRAALTFAIFEAVTPLVGLALGSFVPERWEIAATVVGGVVLLFVGLHVFRESGELDEEVEQLSFSSVRLALLAGVAISLDELAIGFPLHFAHLPIPLVIATIGIQAFIVTLAGMTFGKRLGERFASYTGRVAGIAFVSVGIWIAYSATR